MVSVDAVTATPTSPAPCMAASRIESPSCLRRKMFSSTTMALSTSMPTARASPAMEMTLRVMPA